MAALQLLLFILYAFKCRMAKIKPYNLALHSDANGSNHYRSFHPLRR